MPVCSLKQIVCYYHSITFKIKKKLTLPFVDKLSCLDVCVPIESELKIKVKHEHNKIADNNEIITNLFFVISHKKLKMY